jgi:hypothetical protein
VKHNKMPVDRRMKTKTPEEIPGAGDPDRKRVLNVLAQRRYRRSTTHLGLLSIHFER